MAAMIFLAIALVGTLSSTILPLENQSPYYNAASTIVLRIQVHAVDAMVIAVTFRLPEGFRLYQLSPNQGDLHFFRWPDGTNVVAVSEMIPKGQSKTYVLQLGLPSVGGVYQIDIAWVYYGGRSDLLVDPNHTPAAACFFCNTPCQWGSSTKIQIIVRNMQAIPMIH